jgi:hypothetical protein
VFIEAGSSFEHRHNESFYTFPLVRQSCKVHLRAHKFITFAVFAELTALSVVRLNFVNQYVKSVPIVVNSVRIIAQQKDDCVWVRRLLVDFVYPQLYCTNLDVTTNVVQQNKSLFLLKLLRMSA